MPCTVPKISARAHAGKSVYAHTAKAKTIPGQIKNFLRFIFTLTRIESQTPTFRPACTPVELTISMGMVSSARERTRRGNQRNRGHVREEQGRQGRSGLRNGRTAKGNG